MLACNTHTCAEVHKIHLAFPGFGLLTNALKYINTVPQRKLVADIFDSELWHIVESQPHQQFTVDAGGLPTNYITYQ